MTTGLRAKPFAARAAAAVLGWLARSAWLAWFRAHPFVFREGDISRTFTANLVLPNFIPTTMAQKITTTQRYFLKRVSFIQELTAVPITFDFEFRVYLNGERVAVYDVGPYCPVDCNLVLGPGEITFECYQDDWINQVAYLLVEGWERNTDDNQNRLRALLPAAD